MAAKVSTVEAPSGTPACITHSLITYGAALSHAGLQQNIIASNPMTYISMHDHFSGVRFGMQLTQVLAYGGIVWSQEWVGI